MRWPNGEDILSLATASSAIHHPPTQGKVDMNQGTEHARIIPDNNLHQLTLVPVCAPIGLLGLIKAASRLVFDLGFFSLNRF